MGKEERLAFCKKCTHRRLDMSQEFICGLTGRMASFEESCNDFEADELYAKSTKSTKRIIKKQKKDTKRAKIWFLILFVFFIIKIIRLIMMVKH